MTETLAIGFFSEVDETALQGDLGARVVDSLESAAALQEETRSGVRSIAFKGHTPFDGALMDLFPALGLIANYGVGYDAINVADAQTRGIAVTNTPDVLNDDVADLAVGMLIAQCRRMVQGDHHARSGAWAAGQEFALNRKMSGGRVGILGLGRIGREIADRLAAFKMEIHYWSRREKAAPGWTRHGDPVALAGAVDFLVVALVGGPETEGMVLGGAALDVYRSEPDLDPRFAALDNVVLQPHQGSGTHVTRAAMGQLQRDNIAAFMAGQPLLTQVA